MLMVWLIALIVAGHSRSGLCALTIGLFYSALIRFRTRNVIWTFGLVAAIALLLPHGWIWNRMDVFAKGGRLQIWASPYEVCSIFH